MSLLKDCGIDGLSFSGAVYARIAGNPVRRKSWEEGKRIDSNVNVFLTDDDLKAYDWEIVPNERKKD